MDNVHFSPQSIGVLFQRNDNLLKFAYKTTENIFEVRILNVKWVNCALLKLEKPPSQTCEITRLQDALVNFPTAFNKTT